MPTREESYARAASRFAEQAYEDAIAAYREALEADPRHTDSLHGIAMSQFHLGRVDEAIETARRILEIDPNDVMASTSLSMFYLKKGDVPQAEHHGAQARIKGWEQELRSRKATGSAPGGPPPDHVGGPTEGESGS